MKVKPDKKIEENLKLNFDKPILSASADSNSQSTKDSNVADEWQNKEWANDEDMIFGRLIVVRLKKFNGRDKRVVWLFADEANIFIGEIENLGVDRRKRGGSRAVQTSCSMRF